MQVIFILAIIFILFAYQIIVFVSICSMTFCLIGIKLGEFRINKKQEKLLLWIKTLNYRYKYKINGIDKIITIIQEQYSNEKHIENLLNLFDMCIEGNLQEDFGQKAINNNQRVISEIDSIIAKYSLQMDTMNKTIGKILAEANDMNDKY